MSELVGTTIEGFYQSKPIRTFSGVTKAKCDDPEFRAGHFLGQEVSVNVELVTHPNTSGRIIVNVPGALGDIDGYAEKFKKLAHYIQSAELASVVRTGNDFLAGFLPDLSLRTALEYAKTHAWEICGKYDPEILLMGFSAGASAIAADAHEYPQVTSILLYAPSGDMPDQMIQNGLQEFNGNVCIVIGENDDVVGPQAGKTFYDLATGAQHRELIYVPSCDHQFRGEANGRIMSEAPFYAFAMDDRPKFPDPTGGIKLYD